MTPHQTRKNTNRRGVVDDRVQINTMSGGSRLCVCVCVCVNERECWYRRHNFGRRVKYRSVWLNVISLSVTHIIYQLSLQAEQTWKTVGFLILQEDDWRCGGAAQQHAGKQKALSLTYSRRWKFDNGGFRQWPCYSSKNVFFSFSSLSLILVKIKTATVISSWGKQQQSPLNSHHGDFLFPECQILKCKEWE